MVTVAELEACDVSLTPGSVALVRTGWLEAFDPHAGLTYEQPGLGLDAAGWLGDQGVIAVGADNTAVEAMPFDGGGFMPVHVELLVRRGIYLLEHLVLEHFARDGVARVPAGLRAPVDHRCVRLTGQPGGDRLSLSDRRRRCYLAEDAIAFTTGPSTRQPRSMGATHEIPQAHGRCRCPGPRHGGLRRLRRRRRLADSSADGDSTSSTPTEDVEPRTGEVLDTCALITTEELVAATGLEYGDGVPDEYGLGLCTWRVGGATANNGEGQVVFATQESTLDFIKSMFTGGADVEVDGQDAYWNGDEGLQSMWVDVDGETCLVLSFDPVDEGTQAVAEAVAAIAVGNL